MILWSDRDLVQRKIDGPRRQSVALQTRWKSSKVGGSAAQVQNLVLGG